MKFNPPVYINVRDRVRDLRHLVDWLETADHKNITLLDNASTYQPLLDYLEASPHQVIYLGANLGSYSLWKAELVPDDWFVFTDPDVIPLDECPLNAITRLRYLIESHGPDIEGRPFVKAGLGLYLEDVPESLPCLGWERNLVHESPNWEWPSCRLAPGVYHSLVDTTFALHHPACPGAPTIAIRTGFPYQVRHMPWYITQKDLSEEDRYYLDRCKEGAGFSSWAQGQNWPVAA